MKPVEFFGHNVVLGEGQPQYQPLPARICRDPQGTVISCWELSPDEIRLLIEGGGRLWISQLTFNRGFSPQLPTVEKPQEIQTYEDESRDG